MKFLSASLICLVLVTTLGLGWVFDTAYEHLQPRSNYIDATATAEKIGLQVAKLLDENTHSKLSSLTQDSDFQFDLLPLDELALPQALRQQLLAGQNLLLETQQGLGFHYWLPKHQQILRLNTPALSRNQQDSPIKFVFTLAFYLVLILLFLIWVRPLIKQLLALRDASKALGEGKLDRRLQQSSISYIRDIEREFDRMAERVQQLVEDVKLISNSVSHDLRTPLARLRLGLDTLEEVEDPLHRQKLQQRISSDLDDMTQLVENILSYARMEQNRLQLNKQEIDLTQLLQQLVNKFHGDNVTIVFKHPEQSVHFVGDINYIHMLLTNLLQNAINYGSGDIQLTLALEKQQLDLYVEDNGPGIKPELRDKIIKPFVRGEQQDNQGYGFGLAIVCRILEWHQGKLAISQSKQLGGACFHISLPKSAYANKDS